MAMDKKLKTAWIKALRSGRYKQTNETLKDDGGYCCLGVLLSISRKGEWTDDGAYEIGDEYCEGDLGQYGRRLFGITDKQESALIKMNDGVNGEEEERDFKEIALWIDQNIKVKAA